MNTRNEMPDIEQALHDATHAYADQFEPASDSWSQLRARADEATPRWSRRWIIFGIGGLAIATSAAAVLAIALPADTDEAMRIDVATQPAADGPTTFAKGKDVELVGDTALGGQTLNITAEEEEGEVTGEFRISDNVFTLECADTDTDGVVILGGAATAGNEFVAEGGLHALIIKEGDPDEVSLYANDVGAESCTALLESITDDKLANANDFVDVEDGYDIETA